MKALAYKILSAVDDIDLTYIVNRAIADGWIPTGGIAFRPDGVMYQAMTMVEE